MTLKDYKALGYIYIITNNLNNKKYIGQTSRDINKRMIEHLYCSRSNENRPLYNAIRKYGWKNFSLIFFECGEEILDAMERMLIYLYYTTAKKSGYNLDTGGHKNKHFTQEVREKLSKSHKGHVSCNKGKHLPEETKQKISMTRKLKGSAKGENNYFYDKHFYGEQNPNYGKHLTEETKKKISKANSGENNGMAKLKGDKNPNYGKKATKEAKEKMRVARYKYLETNPGSMKGKHHSDESKKKMSESRTGEKNYRSKKVICLETKIIYGSLSEAERQTGVDRKKISVSCIDNAKTANNYHWMFYHDYLILNQKENNAA